MRVLWERTLVVRLSEILLDASSRSHAAGTKKKAPLACRLHLSLQGLEWFIYNRTAAYDNIIRSMESSNDEQPQDTDGRPSADGIGSLRKIFSWSSAAPDSTFRILTKVIVPINIFELHRRPCRPPSVLGVVHHDTRTYRCEAVYCLGQGAVTELRS